MRAVGAFPAFEFTHAVLDTPAVWHPDPAVSRQGYTVLLFRRQFKLAKPVAHLRIWISASQRYIVYVDGQLMARGPARSDPLRWGCTLVDLGRLPAGTHTLAVQVCHLGDFAGIGQMGGPGFFLLTPEGGTPELRQQISTGPEWRCLVDPSHSPIAKPEFGAHGGPYFAAGAGERMDGALHPWGWTQADYDDTAWLQPRVITAHAADIWGNLHLEHKLRPDPIPAMEERPQRMIRAAEASADYLPAVTAWMNEDVPLTIPAHSQVRLVLDRGELTNAYPHLGLSGGCGAKIRMVWAECPYIKERLKAHRDQTVGNRIFGLLDEYFPDGGDAREFVPLWFRSFRYVEMTITTAEAPLTLNHLRVYETAYPLRQVAKFAVDANHTPDYRQIWDVSWRTARLCAHETFFDCPHFEQAQFPGDTRVQALYHYLVANDDRLARKAIDDFQASRLPEGLTQCRYPSRCLQVLPTFSLYWIGMLHDFQQYRGDTRFVGCYLPFAREVMAWFEQRMGPDGLLGFIEHAPFMDWNQGFACGNAPQGPQGGSAILTTLLATACAWMADLERHSGEPSLAAGRTKQAHALRRAVVKHCWDAQRGYLADTPEKKTYSLHAQVQAILAGVWPVAQGRKILARALTDTTLTQPGSFYYRFYVLQAIRACGLGQEFYNLLPRWTKILAETGLTTWPESDVNPRSDCHAWSIAPVLEFVQTTLGITTEPSKPGFAAVRFAPDLGPLQRAAGTVPTPHGAIKVMLTRTTPGRMTAEVTTPVPMYVVPLRRKLSAGTHRLHWPA